MTINRSISFTATNYEELSQACADMMIGCIQEKPDAVFCLATGYSPLLAYRLFAKSVRERNIDISHLRVVKLDEWLGVDMEHQATCEFFLRREFLTPLGIGAQRYVGFDSMTGYVQADCDRVCESILRWGGIDLIVLGMGRNGHLGLNEPCDAIIPSAHEAVLDQKTQGHDMLKGLPCPITAGVTLGIRDILAARQAILLVCGKEKAEAYSRFSKGLVSPRNPASFLHLHSNLHCLVEHEISDEADGLASVSG